MEIIAKVFKNRCEVCFVVNRFSIIDTSIAVPGLLVKVKDSRNDGLNNDSVAEIVDGSALTPE
jgi:hypothetical protein